MARISPLNLDQATPGIQHLCSQHVVNFQSRITNMKATLAHSSVAFEAYMKWYPLFKELVRITDEKTALIFSYAISTSSDCPLCSTYFRKIIVDKGENPGQLELTELQKKLLSFGASITNYGGHISDSTFNSVKAYFNDEELVILIAFAGQMIATNIFNNAIKTDIDEYLHTYIQVPEQS